MDNVQLVGREAVSNSLSRFLFDHGSSQTRIAFVSGAPGIGKSALANSVLAQNSDKCWIISTKFDQYLNASPAAFFIDALDHVAERLLALPEDQQEALRRKLVDAVSPNGQLLVNLCPRIGPALGAQPELIELAPLENQIRLSMILRKFIGALPSEERRIVLQIDDLQWADPATRRILGDLVVDPVVTNLAVLVGYRSGNSENAEELLRAVRIVGNPVIEIEVDALAEDEIMALLAQRVLLPPENAKMLVRHIRETTGGVPLAAINVIEMLIENRVLKKPEGSGTWSLASSNIATILETSNVIDLMRTRISMLDPDLQKTLNTAASVGDKFDIVLLSKLTGLSNEALNVQIDALRNRQIISGSEFRGNAQNQFMEPLRFQHDTLQQAAFELGESNTGQVEKYRTLAAMEFAQRFEDTGENDWLFRAVNLFERIPDGVLGSEKKEYISKLCRLATRRALDSGGAAMALRFAYTGLQNISKQSWKSDYKNTFSAHIDASEAAYLCNDLGGLEKFSAVATSKARDNIDWAAANRVRLQQRVSAMDYAEALDIAIRMLERLDAKLPRTANKVQVGLGLARTMIALRGLSTDKLFELPHMSDRRAEMELETLMLASSAAYFAEPNLFALIVFRMVRLSLVAGNSALSAFGWVCYGLAQCAVVGNVKAGYDYGVLALRLLEEFKADHLRARVHMLFNVFVRPWSESRAAIESHLLLGEQAGFASGDLEFATYCMWHRCNDAFWAGAPLGEMQEMVRENLQICRGYNQSKVAFLLEMMLDFINWARVETAPVPDDKKHDAYCIERKDFTSLCYVKLFQALRHSINGDSRAVLAATAEIDSNFDSMQGQFYVPYYIVLRSLAANALGTAEGFAPNLRRMISSGARQTEKWANKGASDVVPLANIAQACLQHSTGKYLEAFKLLDRSLDQASELSAPTHIAMLAARTLADMQVRTGLNVMGQRANQEAGELAQYWGSDRADVRLNLSLRARDTDNQRHAINPVRNIPEMSEPLEMQAVKTARSIFDLVGGTNLEIIFADEGYNASLARIETDQNGKLHAILHGRRIGDADIADLTEQAQKGKDVFIPEISKTVCLKIPQPDKARIFVRITDDKRFLRGFPMPKLIRLATPLVEGLRQEDLKRRMKDAEMRNVDLSTAYARFIPNYILRELGHQQITDLGVGDFASRRMTVMFCDMRGATGIMEQIGPRESMELFNELFTAIESEVLRGGGFIDNFIGDAVVALFSSNADIALGTVVSVSQALHKLQRTIQMRGLPAPSFGLGASTGDVVFGVVGGLNQIRVGSIGDALNLAARVESLTKIYGASALVADHTYKELAKQNTHTLRQVDYVTVVGRKNPVRLYEMVDALPIEKANRIRTILPLYEQAIEAFYTRDFSKAVGAFRSCLTVAPGDIAISKLLERALDFKENGVPGDWDGINHLNDK